MLLTGRGAPETTPNTGSLGEFSCEVQEEVTLIPLL